MAAEKIRLSRRRMVVTGLASPTSKNGTKRAPSMDVVSRTVLPRTFLLFSSRAITSWPRCMAAGIKDAMVRGLRPSGSTKPATWSVATAGGGAG
jgi:hypothetical protein